MEEVGGHIVRAHTIQLWTGAMQQRHCFHVLKRLLRLLPLLLVLLVLPLMLLLFLQRLLLMLLLMGSRRKVEDGLLAAPLLHRLVVGERGLLGVIKVPHAPYLTATHHRRLSPTGCTMQSMCWEEA